MDAEEIALSMRKEFALKSFREETLNPKIAGKLARLAAINGNLGRLNATEPLLPEFDEILAKRANFPCELNL
jgi:hypothetical protein